MLPEDLRDALSVPADFLALSAQPPLVLRGRLVCTEDRCVVELPSEPAGLRPGLGVVVDAGRARGLRVVGRVLNVEGVRVELQVQRVQRPDQRDFPREVGEIPLRYLPEPAEPGAARRWLAGEPLPGDWREPEPFVDFSASGLQFEGHEPLGAGQRLLLELAVPGCSRRLRALARVVRAEALSPEELEGREPRAGRPLPSQRVALAFVELPDATRDALVGYTLRQQGRWAGEE